MWVHGLCIGSMYFYDPEDFTRQLDETPVVGGCIQVWVRGDQDDAFGWGVAVTHPKIQALRSDSLTAQIKDSCLVISDSQRELLSLPSDEALMCRNRTQH